MISRSEAARYAKSLFYAQYNDIDVFIEDTAIESRKIYVELLNRVLGSNLSISQVFPIGSKPTVLKRCGEDQDTRERPAVYIIDGDYDVLLDKTMPNLKRLYRLSRYCIENYLLDAAAIVDVLTDESLRHDQKQITGMLDFAGWQAAVERSLGALVVALAISHQKQCGLATVKIDLASIRGAHEDHVDSAKLAKMQALYREEIDKKYGEGTFGVYEERLNRKLAEEGFFLAHASGKSLLMPLVLARIGRRVGMHVDYRKFKVKLARRCDVSELGALASAIM